MSELINALPSTVTNGQGGGASASRSRVQSLLQGWRRLSGDSRSIIVVALLAALVAAAIVIILWTNSGQYVPLYGNQERYDSASILEVLEAETIDFELDSRSGNILVPKDQIASARMKLAARGVTAQMPAGIDGLNELSGISTSQFMESTRYTHAVEGELARTIMTLEQVRNARVHLAIPERTLFVGREEQTPTASVVLDLSGHLNETQVEAIVNLVAAGIPGMKPGSVSVVNQAGELLSAGIGEDSPGRVSTRQMDYISKLEDKVASRASDMLEPMLGVGNFRVRVAADVDFSEVEETREVLDGEPVLLSENSVMDNAAGQLALGIPGALTNQPPVPQPEQADEEGQDAAAVNRREEVNRRFETGRAVTHTRLDEARVRQLSVSVLVNDGNAPEGGWTQAQLDKMSALVHTAAGLDTERGDVITLQSAPFVAKPAATPAPQATPWYQDLAPWETHIRYALGSLMLLLLILFGIRPLVKHLTNGAAGQAQNRFASKRNQDTGDSDDDERSVTPTSTTAGASASASAEASASKQDAAETSADATSTLSLPPPGSELEVQLEHLRLLADKETNRVADVIKSWVEDHGHTSR